MTKPKKPLRGLFASTENVVPTPTRPPIQVPTARKETPQRPVPNQKQKMPPERLVPPPKINQNSPMMIMDSTPAAAETSPAVVEVVEVAPAVVEVTPTIADTTPAIVSAPATIETVRTNDERIMQIQYNFDSMRSVRESWKETDYAQFLRRLEAVQTEAFFLRGKLLAEAKDRFFETNKVGWAEFCETTLDMNYTTANQYIRVALEFDVTSHQRSDFGFEHYKALLPLPAEARSEFLNAEQGFSVKMIRTRVKEILGTRSGANADAAPISAHRKSMRLIRMLQAMKGEIIAHGESFEELPQTQRWQIAAACTNIAAHLTHLAQTLNSDPTTTQMQRSGSPRAGAFATAHGVATMHELTTTPDSTDGTP